MDHQVVAPFSATVTTILVDVGDEVAVGQVVAVLESMKIEHPIETEWSGVITTIDGAVGDTLAPGDVIVGLTAAEVASLAGQDTSQIDPTAIRPDLAEVLDRRRLLEDSARPDAVAKRHRLGRRTARENLADLVEPGSFEEYGGLAVAAQMARRDRDDLIANTAADGFIGGLARVNSDWFDDDASRCAVMSYDYMVLAGTQGQRGHDKKDRLLPVVERLRLPVVLFAEGGGGRPGDTDTPAISGNDLLSFSLFAGLSGLVPLVGIVSGRCFAGNAALAGCCDVIIATEDANLGMAGPAMIEGGGLGQYEPEDIGPVSVQQPNGVLDLVVADDEAAVAAAKRYLSYFQGSLPEWTCADQRLLRATVPERRKQAYDVRHVVEGLADTGSVMELRRAYGVGMITALARFEGRPVGVIANNSTHLGGAIDADGADKAARFMQLCDAHDLPLLFLVDTPGFMVGPEAENTAQVRRFSRMMVTGASLSVPYFSVLLRKGVGLGALAMSGGSFHAPLFTVAWPTGEISGMGLEGAVRLGSRRQLEAIADDTEREAAFDAMVAAAYQRSRAMEAAMINEIDDVIDPADTRARIVNTLRACPPPAARTTKKRPMVDTW
ncbi:MAG: carboxyl transferase domain-containing protein [Acidimicrobiales bacterium]